MATETAERSLEAVESIGLVVGLEVHVELRTRSKMFSRSANVAHPDYDDADPNTLIDPTVLGLPGALPVPNRGAIEMSMMVGLALGCSIAEETKWDRKSYFYPDLPKSYQISQYDLPLCFDGHVEIPLLGEDGEPHERRPFGSGVRRIGIIRAHLEEDAGKLLHEAPGGRPIDFSIVDYNRAGTPLLEIVTHPDFRTADEVVFFARNLRNICRFLGVSDAVMQKGQMRFEPNINTVLTMRDGRRVCTPIVEVKNLNSFRSLRGAIEHELAEQPKRWVKDGRVLGPGEKTTRGWDDGRGVTVLQRGKEDAHDYRYFPDPDLTVLRINEDWRETVRARIPELPLARFRRYVEAYDLSVKEAAALVEDRDVCLLYEGAVDRAVEGGVLRETAGRLGANMVLQSGLKRANEAGVLVSELGITERQVAEIIVMRDEGVISASAADTLFGKLCEQGYSGRGAQSVAEYEGLLTIRDEGKLDAWCDEVIAANGPIVEQVRGGKTQAVGRLIGEVMKLSGGAADAKEVRERLLERIGSE